MSLFWGTLYLSGRWSFIDFCQARWYKHMKQMKGVINLIHRNKDLVLVWRPGILCTWHAQIWLQGWIRWRSIMCRLGLPSSILEMVETLKIFKDLWWKFFFSVITVSFGLSPFAMETTQHKDILSPKIFKDLWWKVKIKMSSLTTRADAIGK